MNSRIIVVIIFLLASASSAEIIHVPGDQPTIQDGINAVNPGDTVLVADGIYFGDGNIDISNQNRTFVLLSSNGPETTIIDGQSAHEIFDISGFGSTGVIAGFTIRNGLSDFNGAGLRFVDCDATIRNCIFHDNTNIGQKDGGAVTILHGSPRFVSCIFENNKALKTSWPTDPIGEGGAIFSLGANPIIDSCFFVHNKADIGGAIGCALGNGIIRNSVFINNYSPDRGAAIKAQDTILIENCTFYADGSAAVSAIRLSTGGSPCEYVLRNCNITYGGGLEVFEIDNLDIRNSNIFGNFPGDWDGNLSGFLPIYGNISSAPLFCDTAASDLTLASNSPCLGAGGGGINIGALGEGCGPIVDARENAPGTLPTFYLLQNRPNPFNNHTVIEYTLASRVHVSLVINDILGRAVQTLVDQDQPAGRYGVPWNGCDRHGIPLPSGIYFYTIDTEDFTDTKQLILLK